VLVRSGVRFLVSSNDPLAHSAIVCLEGIVRAMSTATSDLRQPVDVVELDADGQVANRAREQRTAPGQVIVLDDDDAVDACLPLKNTTRRRPCDAAVLSPRPVKRPRPASEEPSTIPPRVVFDVSGDSITADAVPAVSSDISPVQVVRNRVPGHTSPLGTGTPLAESTPLIAAVRPIPPGGVGRLLSRGSPVPSFVPASVTVVIEDDDDDDDDVVAVSVASRGPRASLRSHPAASRIRESSGGEREVGINSTVWPRASSRSSAVQRAFTVPGPSTARHRHTGVAAGATSRAVSGSSSSSVGHLAPGLLIQLLNTPMLASSARNLAQLHLFRQALYDAARSNTLIRNDGAERGSLGMPGSHRGRESVGPSRAYGRYQSGNLFNFTDLRSRGGGLTYEALSRLDDSVDSRHRGASLSKIRLLPVRLATAADTSLTCCICICDVEAGDELRTLPCAHQYHVKCIDSWLKRNACCPVDKRRIDI
jgi:hypothetical protein